MKKQYVFGGSGILDSISIFKFLVRTFTSQDAKQISKDVGKAALDASKSLATEAGKKLIDKVINPNPNPSKKQP